MNHKGVLCVPLVISGLLITLGIVDLVVSQLNQSPKCGTSPYGHFALLEYLTVISIMYMVSGVILMLFIIIYFYFGDREDKSCMHISLKIYLGMCCLVFAILSIVGLVVVLPSNEGQYSCQILNFPLWQLSISILILTPFMLLVLLILSVITCMVQPF